MGALVELKTACDDFEVEFEVVPIFDFKKPLDERQKKILEGIASIDEMMAENQKVVDELNSKIDTLTNNADTLDYIVAVCSGVVAGAIDVLFVEDFSLQNANAIGNQKIDDKIIKAAKKHGYKGDDLKGAVRHLEDSFPIAADKATNDFGGALQHHLRDFSHHPTPVGLFFSMLTQFTEMVYGTDTAGVFKVVPLNKEGLTLVGKNLPEKITFGVINWWLHLLSDMAGTSGSIAKGSYGTGLPGPLVSLLKEMSALPIFKKTNEKGYKELSVWISKLFNGTLLGEKDANGNIIKFDLRTEVGFTELLKDQAKPVIFNECIVRGFYFIRRFSMELKNPEIKSIKDLNKINWRNTLPFKNRTIIRMLTISTGTMTAIDLAFAAGESAVKSGGVGPAFVSNMVMKVNFVGLGRFALAVGSDVKMGVDRSKLRDQRIVVMNERLFLMNGKTYYKQAEMWIAAEDAGQTIEEAYNMMEETANKFAEAYADNKDSMEKIGSCIPQIEEKYKGLISGMSDVLKWG